MIAFLGCCESSWEACNVNSARALGFELAGDFELYASSSVSNIVVPERKTAKDSSLTFQWDLLHRAAGVTTEKAFLESSR